MDTCTPNSRTSTVCKLTVKLAGCPEFMCGIVRLIRYGGTIILKHPEVGNRLQRLNCGDVGHPMARCRYDADQIRGPGSQVATEQEVGGLEDLAVPFGSMAEVKRMASLRLQLQVENDIKAKDAVEPSQTPVGAAAIDYDTVLPVAATPPINAGNLVAPAPKT